MAKLISCKVCSKEIARSAKNCPHCGAPNKKSRLIVITFIIIIILIIVALLGENKSQKISSEIPKPKEVAYESAHGLDYRKATLAQIQIGSLISFTGEISQIIRSNEAMISTKNTDFGYVGDQVFLTFNEKPQIVRDDIVRILGRYNGTMEYKTVMGNQNVVPSIIVDYYKVIKQKR